MGREQQRYAGNPWFKQRKRPHQTLTLCSLAERLRDEQIRMRQGGQLEIGGKHTYYACIACYRGAANAAAKILEERGLEVYLVNARHTKNLPGRKSDVQESQWLLKLHTHGLSTILSSLRRKSVWCGRIGGNGESMYAARPPAFSGCRRY
jgi:hypothetical protein